MSRLFLFCYGHDVFLDKPFPWSASKIAELNVAIDVRYRQQGWGVGWVRYNNWGVSDRLDCRQSDLDISDGQNVYDDACGGVVRRCADGAPAFSRPVETAAQIPAVDSLRVGGFHSGDCVDKIAAAAYARGIPTMVDDELTEFFGALQPQDNFRASEFMGSHRMRYFEGRTGMVCLEHFLSKRDDKPWLYNWRADPRCPQIAENL